MKQKEYIFKSNLVVWNTGEIPVIETFHADTLEEIQLLQEQWMADNNYTLANMNLYRMEGGEWVNIEKCQFKRMPDLPEFTFLQCSPHEKKEIHSFMSGTVLQVETGRIARIASKDRDNNDGFLNTNFIYELDGKDITFSVAVIKLNEDDMDYINENDIHILKQMMMEELFKPLCHWFMQYLACSRKF